MKMKYKGYNAFYSRGKLDKYGNISKEGKFWVNSLSYAIVKKDKSIRSGILRNSVYIPEVIIENKLKGKIDKIIERNK